MAEPQQTLQYDAPAAPPQVLQYDQAKKPGILDREIPLDSYTHATESGLQSIGRGFRSAGRGLYNTVAHPIDTAEGIIDSVTDLPSQVKQVPGAIRDINASPDPLGTYAKVGQETAGEGAPQLLTAAAMEKLGEGGVKGIRRIGPPAVRGVVKGANTVLEKAPGTIGAGVGAGIGHATGLPGAAEVGGAIGYGVGREVLPKVKIPGEHFGLPERVIGGPKTAPQYVPPPPFRDAGAPLPEHPGSFPGAHLPETPAPEQLNPALASEARTLPGQIGKEVIRPKIAPAAPIPSRSGLALPPAAEATAADAATASTSEASPGVTPVARPSATTSSRLEELLNDAVGARELEPNIPLRQQLSRIGKPAPTSKMGPITNLSQQLKDSAPASEAPKMAPLTNLSQQIKNSAVALPEGFTPVESEALRGYKYNPEAREFEAITNNGQHYVHTDVSPEQASDFAQAESKGKAWNELRKSPGVTLTKKGPAGSPVPVKPGQLRTTKGVIAKADAGMNPDADLSDEWQRNNEFLKSRRKPRVANSNQ